MAQVKRMLIDRGQDTTARINLFTETNQIEDITGATEIVVRFSGYPGETPAPVEKKLSLGGVSFVSTATECHIDIPLAVADTNNLIKGSMICEAVITLATKTYPTLQIGVDVGDLL